MTRSVPEGVGGVAASTSTDRHDAGAQVDPIDGATSGPVLSGRFDRLFGSKQFFRLWLAMVNSAIGDWLGFFAIAAMADRIGGSLSVGAVFAARIAPGLLFSQLGGVIADRWDRKKVLVTCDVGRALVLLSLPFVDSSLGLVLASLVLEMFTLVWQPAKESTVPNLVAKEHLTTANSMSVVAGYGTFPLAAGLFGLLAKFAERVEDNSIVQSLNLSQEGIAFYVDALTFVVAALIISSIRIPPTQRSARVDGAGNQLVSVAGDLAAGWRFVVGNPVVRSVNVGLATGLIGGGMLLPLGKRFVNQVLGAGNAGYGLFVFMLGLGTALGVVGVSLLQNHIPKSATFTLGVTVSGICLFGATSVTSLTPAALLVAGLGVCAGTVYVLGFTLLHENVKDEFRGRSFSTLNTLVRMCLLVAFAGGPFLTSLFDGLSNSLFDRSISPFGFDIYIPGIRLTMWLAASIMVFAGVAASRTLRHGTNSVATSADDSESAQ